MFALLSLAYVFMCNDILLTDVSFFIPQTNLVGLDGLHKAIDPGQLTSDLSGSFPYDHSTWIELRRVSGSVGSRPSYRLPARARFGTGVMLRFWRPSITVWFID